MVSVFCVLAKCCFVCLFGLTLRSGDISSCIFMKYSSFQLFYLSLWSTVSWYSHTEWGKGQRSFFFFSPIEMPNCFSNTCGRLFFLLNWHGALSKIIRLYMCGSIILLSIIFHLYAHANITLPRLVFPYCKSSSQSKFSNFVLYAQHCSDCSRSFAFSCIFKASFSIPLKIPPRIWIAWNMQTL